METKVYRCRAEVEIKLEVTGNDSDMDLIWYNAHDNIHDVLRDIGYENEILDIEIMGEIG